MILMFTHRVELFKKEIMNKLYDYDLEVLQLNGIYQEEDEFITQDEIEELFMTSDWQDGLTVYFKEIIEYIEYQPTETELFYIDYITNKE